MSTTPQRVDVLIRNSYIVTFDDEGNIWESGSIAIQRGRILAIGDPIAMDKQFVADKIIDGSGTLAMPGLIDSHTHIAQTLMKGLFPELVRAGRLRQPVWRQYLIPFESHLTDADMQLSADLAFAAMLRHGTTTFFDAGGPHPHALARAAVSAGIRGIVSRSTLDDSHDIPESMRMTTDQAIEENVRLVDSWPAGERVSASMALRQIMNCSPELIRAIHSEARSRGVKIHTHLLEGADEVDYSVQRYGKRPIDFLIDLGVFDASLHCAHSVYATPWDVQKFAKHDVSVGYCRNNYYFGVPRALEFWRSGVAIGLGTDGAATSQGTLDMFRIASAVALGQQHVYGVPAHELGTVEPDEALKIATRGGAAALGMSDRIGQLSAGAEADIVLLDLDGPDASVSVTPFSYLVDAATGHDVTTVIVAGEVVVEDGEVLTVDHEALRAKGKARQREIVSAISA